MSFDPNIQIRFPLLLIQLILFCQILPPLPPYPCRRRCHQSHLDPPPLPLPPPPPPTPFMEQPRVERGAASIKRRLGGALSLSDFCYHIVVFNNTGVFIIITVPICMYKNVTKYLKIICTGDFFIFAHFLMGRWWLLCTTLCSSKLRFGYQ